MRAATIKLDQLNDKHKKFTYEHWEANPFHLPMTPMLSRKVRDDQTRLEELTAISKELIQRDFLRFLGSYSGYESVPA